MFNLSFATLLIGSCLASTLITPEIESTLPILLKLQALIAITTGVTAGALISVPHKIESFLLANKFLNHFLTSIAFATPINSQVISRLPIFLGHSLQKNIDRGWIETLGGQGTLITLSPLRSSTSASLGKSLSSNVLVILFIGSLLFFIFKSSLKRERHTEDVDVGYAPFIAPLFS